MYRKQFADLRKQNNVTWITRNLKWINWIITSIFIVLLVVGIILLSVNSINVLNDVNNVQNNQTTLNALSKLNLVKDSINKLSSPFGLIWAGTLGLLISRIWANACLIFRAIIDHKKAGIKNPLFTVRICFLSSIIIILIALIICLSLSIEDWLNLITNAMNSSEAIVNKSIQAINSISSNPNITPDQYEVIANTIWEYTYPAIQTIFDNVFQNTAEMQGNIQAAIASLVFIILWIIDDIAYGITTLATAGSSVK